MSGIQRDIHHKYRRTSFGSTKRFFTGNKPEWKVAYKSIVSFKCWIFNKWGVQMFYFDSPDQGWDGKYRGKYVDPGVYYYVIEAKGANNKKMKLKGHINILRPKN